MEPIKYGHQSTIDYNRMNLKNILAGLTALLLLCFACGSHKTTEVEPKPEPVRVVEVDTTFQGLVLYYPLTDSIGLRCFTRPDPAVDSSIVFCCAAAFTADYDTTANHSRICGDHVSGGQYYRRPKLKRNTGAFVVWQNGQYDFLHESAYPDFGRVFPNAAEGFTQESMIYRGHRVKTTRPDKNVNQFRALCKIDGRLCIADAAESMPFGQFITLLLNARAEEAIYMDMGAGWNYSWYREYADSAATFIHPWPLSSATNWLVFHRK